jgi:hypothetical protein
VENRFAKKAEIAGIERMIYTAHNVPTVIQITINALMPYTIQESRYVLLAPMQHLPHAAMWSRDRPSIQMMSRTFDMRSRQQLQKNPPAVVGD